MTTNTQMQRLLGGIEQGYKDVTHATGPITIGIYDALVLVDTSTGAIGNITLPNTVPVGTAREHSFLDVGDQANVNPFTILAPGGGSINGAASLTINEPNGGCTLLTKDGLNYKTPTTGAGVVGPSNAVYVDPAGNDATGTRGNFAFPFLTLEAAFAALQQGDELLIAPGLYQPLISLTPPVGVTELVIRGSGRVTNTDPTGATYFGGTMITDALNGVFPVFSFPNVMAFVLIRELTTVSTQAGIMIDGSTSAGLFGLNGVYIENCNISGLNVLNVNILRIVSCDITSQCLLHNCSDAVFTASETHAGCLVGWDDSDANKPITARDTTHFQGAVVDGSLEAYGQPDIEVDAGSTIEVLTGNTLSVANGKALVLRCYGRVTGAVDFLARPLPDTAVACVLDFDGALLDGPTIDFEVAGAPPTHRQTVSMRNTTIDDGALQAGSAIDVDGRGVAFGAAASITLSGAPEGTYTQTTVNKTVVHNTGAYTAGVGDFLTQVDTSTGTIGDISLPNTMPDANGCHEWTFEDSGGSAATNPITIKTVGGGGTINGVAAFVINWNYGRVVIRSKKNSGTVFVAS